MLIFGGMNEDGKMDFIYSKDFYGINHERLKDACVHMICKAGEGSFVFNETCYRFHGNDLAVLGRPTQVFNLASNPGLEIEYFAAPYKFLHSLLSPNNYSIGGGISLYHDPIIHLDGKSASVFLGDIHNLQRRMDDREHPFYREMMGSLCLTLIYDVFAFHASQYGSIESTERRSYAVSRLLKLLDTGVSKTEREVAYYARRLNVSPKYLSDTIRRNTGQSVVSLISRYTVPILREYLNDERLSLTQIAETMNFTSLSYFSRYCTKHLGMSPSEYRKSLQPDKEINKVKNSG